MKYGKASTSLKMLRIADRAQEGLPPSEPTTRIEKSRLPIVIPHAASQSVQYPIDRPTQITNAQPVRLKWTLPLPWLACPEKIETGIPSRIAAARASTITAAARTTKLAEFTGRP